MAMLFIHQGGPKKQKKKPGWKNVQKEHDEWLKSVNSMKLFDSKLPKAPAKLPSKMPSLATRLQETKRSEGASLVEPGLAGCTKKVHRPEIVYKDDPEMLERELKARERKFAVAPAYNKGGDQLVTEEFMKDLKAGTTRRRS